MFVFWWLSAGSIKGRLWRVAVWQPTRKRTPTFCHQNSLAAYDEAIWAINKPHLCRRRDGGKRKSDGESGTQAYGQESEKKDGWMDLADVQGQLARPVSFDYRHGDEYGWGCESERRGTAWGGGMKRCGSVRPRWRLLISPVSSWSTGMIRKLSHAQIRLELTVKDFLSSEQSGLKDAYWSWFGSDLHIGASFNMSTSISRFSLFNVRNIYPLIPSQLLCRLLTRIFVSQLNSVY